MSIDTSYGFDPAYGYSLLDLLKLNAPKEPRDFKEFWQQRYQAVLQYHPQLELNELYCRDQWRVFSANYRSSNDFLIKGWLLIPQTIPIRRGFIIGHGYGGRDEPDWHLPFDDAALFFPCFRGLGQSYSATISSDPQWHVLHNIDSKQDYILGGCVEDIWFAVSALLTLLPELAGHLGYLGISFGGGIGAMALAWDNRISQGHLNAPTFGDQSLRLRLPTHGSASSVQCYYHQHKKATLQVLRYYDAAFAARYIRIPMHCACARYDPCVAPPGQFAIYNALSPLLRQLFVLQAGHHHYDNAHQEEQIVLHQLERFFQPLISKSIIPCPV